MECCDKVDIAKRWFLLLRLLIKSLTATIYVNVVQQYFSVVLLFILL